MSIKYSVLVPVYNVEKYIKECIESVLDQTYTNYELILVDDGTPDNSGAICDEYAQKDSRIIVFHKENQGLIHTRRYAIERASGDYFIFLDSDDTIKKNALEIIDAKIRQYDCDCLIYGLERLEEGKVVSQIFDPIEENLHSKSDIYRKVFLKTDYNSLCRKAVKASVFHDIDYSPYYHLRYTEDLLQSLEIYKYSKTIAFIPDVLYEYRTNLESITHGPDRMNVDYTIRKKVLDFLRNESDFSDEDYNQYRDFCISMVISDIMKISLLYNHYAQIRQKLDSIREDKYYKEFLSKGITNRNSIGSKSLIFDLFMHKKDILLVSMIRIGYYIKNKMHK